MPSVKSSKEKSKGKKNSKKKEVIYPEVDVFLKSGEEAIDFDFAVQLMGWQQSDPEEDEKFEDPLLKLNDGSTVVCQHNTQNRPFLKSIANQYMGDHLSGNWRMNGEPIIVGEYGSVLSGQHRLISFILAVLAWREDQTLYPFWDNEPLFHTIVVVGVKEIRDVINTIDTGKPRSLADAIIAAGILGTGANTKKAVKDMARGLQYAVGMLVQRTGVADLSYSPKPSHSFCLDYLDRHPKLIEALRYVFEEEGEKEKRFTKGGIGPGYVTALMYLMASCLSDSPTYLSKDPPSESDINFESWNKAEEFWTLFAGRSKEFKSLFNALGKIDDEDGSLEEKIVLLTLAWREFSVSKPITTAKLKLKYTEEDGEGVQTLLTEAFIGGLDEVDYDDEVEEEEEGE